MTASLYNLIVTEQLNNPSHSINPPVPPGMDDMLSTNVSDKSIEAFDGISLFCQQQKFSASNGAVERMRSRSLEF